MEINEQSAIEDIAFIRKVISDSKNIITENGIDFITWGIIVVIGLTYTYLDIIHNFSLGNAYTWFILIGIGWVYSITRNIKRHSGKRVRTLSGKILGATWFSLGITATIMGFVGPMSGAYDGVYISPLISLILGSAYLISGVILNRFWISLLSIFWWLGAVYMFLMPDLNSLLVMASMMLLFQVVPGIILYVESQKAKETE